MLEKIVAFILSFHIQTKVGYIKAPDLNIMFYVNQISQNSLRYLAARPLETDFDILNEFSVRILHMRTKLLKKPTIPFFAPDAKIDVAS